jgi:hypothetical protein
MKDNPLLATAGTFPGILPGEATGENDNLVGDVCGIARDCTADDPKPQDDPEDDPGQQDPAQQDPGAMAPAIWRLWPRPTTVPAGSAREAGPPAVEHFSASVPADFDKRSPTCR